MRDPIVLAFSAKLKIWSSFVKRGRNMPHISLSRKYGAMLEVFPGLSLAIFNRLSIKDPAADADNLRGLLE
jgi:hypothetical protein